MTLTPAQRAFHAAARAYRPTPPQTATHEAGHVLAYLATGTPFALARLAPLALQGAAAKHGEVRSNAFHTADPWVRVVILLAGGLAEGTYKAAESDVAQVAAISRAWTTDRSPGSPGAAGRDLVYGHRAEVAAIAEILLAEGEVGPRHLLTVVPSLVALLETVRPPVDVHRC